MTSRLAKMIVMGMLGGGGIPIPNAAFSYVPFKIQQNGATFTPKNWSVSSLAPTGKAYYFSKTGNDSSDGLTLATAKRNLYSAPEDIVVCYINGGHWGWTDNFRNALAGTLKAIIGLNQVTYSNDMEYYAGWTADETSWKFTTTRAIGAVWDKSSVDANGHYLFYALVADVATCKTTAGSYYKDAGGNLLYVHCFDNREPDTNIVAVFDGSLMSGGVGRYFENIDFKFVGGGVAARAFRAFGNGDAASYCYMKNCSLSYNSTPYDSIDIDGVGFTIFEDCWAEKGLLDGFNYHAQSGVIPKSIEIRCSARWFGTVGDEIKNASTIHDGASIVRIMGDYYSCYGPTIADVNNSRTWCLGTKSHGSLTASSTNTTNYLLGNTPDGSLMWLDTCQSYDSEYDITNQSNTVVYTRNFTGDATNSIAGALSTY